MKKNLLYVYGVNFINGLAGLAFIPLALYSLGAEGYGIYSIFIILTSYIYFVEMGVAKYFTRTIAQTQLVEDQRNKMQTAVGIYIRIALILLCLMPVLLYIIPKYIFIIDENGIIGKMVILSILDYLFSIPVAILLAFNTGKEQFYKISKYNLISGITRHAFLICGVLLFKSVIVIMCIIVIRRFFDLMYAFRYLDPLPEGAWKPTYKKGEFLNIIKQSLFLSAAQLLQITILAVGTYLVNKNFSLTEVGIYKSSFDIATKVWFLSNGLGMVIFPRFATLVTDKENKKALLNKLVVYIKGSWILYNVCFLIAFFIYPKISNILLIEDLNLFFFLLFGVCLNAHTNLSYEFLQADSRLKEVIIISVTVLISMIVGFYLLVDNIGLYAIGLSWLGSQLLYSLVMDYSTIKDLKFRKWISTLLFNLGVFISIVLLLILFMK